jgi:nucleotide-binding universal stress UspA family protein
MMTPKGIHLKDILGSALVQEQVKVRGIEGLRQLADEQAAHATKSREKSPAIHIVHTVGGTSIDISLSNVDEMQAALVVIGYTRKGIFRRVRDWLV